MNTNRKRVTGRMVVIHNGSILLMERRRNGQHYYSVPGGGVEKGETPAEAAERELMEEMGVQARAVRPIYRVELADKVHHIFLGEYISGEPRLLPDSPEARMHCDDNYFRPRWVPADKVKELPIVYWNMLKPYLVRGLERGFPEHMVTIRHPSE